jgi:adenylosuccinate lyase
MVQYLDSTLFRDAFSTPEMRRVFSDTNYYETFLEVESALARAEAEAGVIPKWAAEEITQKATISQLDLDRLEELISDTGHPAMSLIGAWKQAFDEAGEYIHWGATTQDILDTTMVLQVREALEIVRRDIESLRDQLVDLADEHKDTPIPGRTHFVQAVPMTLGLKIAVWINELNRHLDRLDAAADRAITLEFFGAVGTLASLGEPGLEVQHNLAEELDLPVPDVCWHSARDRPAEVLSILADVGSSVGKMARQVLTLNRPEIGELSETPAEGHIGSSTMPHKNNPKKAELTVALSRMVRAQSSVMTEVMGTMDERDATNWYCEFALIPNAFLYSSRLFDRARELFETLVIHPERMQSNLHIHGELIASERMMMALAESVGRQTAHEIISEAAERAFTGDQSFSDVLMSDERVADTFSPEEVAELLDPATYVGLSTHFVEEVIESSRSR